jgi:hypothetical protein
MANANSSASPSQDEVEDRIRKWLLDEGWQLTEQAATKIRFAFVAQDGTGLKMVISQPADKADRLSISANVTIDDKANKMLGALPQKKRREFLWNLRFALLQTDVEFGGISEPLKQVSVGEPIFYDGLSKDRFMEKLSQVRKAILLILWSFARLAEEPPPKMGFVKG